MFTLWFKICLINCSQRYFCWYELSDRTKCRSLLCSFQFKYGMHQCKCNCECLDICCKRMDTQSLDRSNVLREVLMIRDGLLEFSCDLLKFSELDDFVKLLASWFTFFFMLYIMYEFHNKINYPISAFYELALCVSCLHNVLCCCLWLVD